MTAKFNVRGAQELKASIARLRDAPKGRVIDAAAFDALEILKDETENRAPRPSLRRGVAIAKVASRGDRARRYWVAFKRGMAMRIAHLVELGTAPHSLAKGASRRYGIMQDVPPFHPGTAPEPFFRPAFEMTKEAVNRRLGENFWNIMVSSIRRSR